MKYLTNYYSAVTMVIVVIMTNITTMMMTMMMTTMMKGDAKRMVALPKSHSQGTSHWHSQTHCTVEIIIVIVVMIMIVMMMVGFPYWENMCCNRQLWQGAFINKLRMNSFPTRVHLCRRTHQ